MSNFSIIYFKKFYVFQTIEGKTIELLVNNDFEGKWKEILLENNLRYKENSSGGTEKCHT